jgi:prepilin-type N-terminal cleavage/methylation domain-containing protein
MQKYQNLRRILKQEENMKWIEKIDQRKRRKHLNYDKRLISGQSGFTLIEILVSIVILVLLFVPVLSGFMTSSKVNQKAKQTQKATILAQNMMESVKAMSLPELAIQFNGGGSFQVIKSNLDGYTGNYIMDNYAGNGFGEYIINNDNTFSRLTLASSPVSSVSKVEDTYTFDPPAGRKKFVFGIENLRDEKSAFDVVMQVDATRYSDNSKYTGTMNNFIMPNLLQLSEKEVALIDLEGASTIWSDDSESAVKVSNNSTDSQAMSDLYNMHLSYISYLNSIRGPKDPPVSSYYTEQNIRDKVIKNIIDGPIYARKYINRTKLNLMKNA